MLVDLERLSSLHKWSKLPGYCTQREKTRSISNRFHYTGNENFSDKKWFLNITFLKCYNVFSRLLYTKRKNKVNLKLFHELGYIIMLKTLERTIRQGFSNTACSVGRT